MLSGGHRWALHPAPLLAVLVAFSATVVLEPGDVMGGECPPLAGPPPDTPAVVSSPGWWELLAPPLGIATWHGRLDDAPLGVGHLVVEQADAHFYDWPHHVVLPLWRRPRGATLGWLAGARVHPAEGGAAWPLSGAGMVETGYEHLTLVVIEARGDGAWLRLRLAPGEDGEAWTHACHLGLGRVTLRYQPWVDYLRAHGDWLHFRNRVNHALRAAPDTGSRRLDWIGTDHELQLLELAGDWMRVRVDQPAWRCSGPSPPADLRRDEGWVRWRDAVSGPWVWVHTRGC